VRDVRQGETITVEPHEARKRYRAYHHTPRIFEGHEPFSMGPLPPIRQIARQQFRARQAATPRVQLVFWPES
jgi:hypothetical protein